MLEQTHDEELIIDRVAALDIGKAEVMCCVRVPGDGRSGRRRQEVQAYSTMTRSLLGLAGRLLELQVTRVVMEATSDYWKPVYYLLEAHGFEPWLVNAKDVKHLPGRPKTVLRPGTFFTCRALTSDTSRASTSHRAWKTGFQYTPVASIPTWVTPCSTSHPTICRSTW